MTHESQDACDVVARRARCSALSSRGCATPPPQRAGLDAHRAHHRDLRREPQLRQSVRAVPRRQRHRQRDAGAVHAGRPRRQAAAARCRRSGRARTPIPRFRSDLPNKPFRIDAPPINLPLSAPTRDLVHKFYQNQEQINGGRNDRFVAASDAGALAMGYYDGSTLPLWKWAQEYTLADNFFMGAFGGSYLNHFWLICACTPVDRERAGQPARAARRARLAEDAADVAGLGARRARRVPATATSRPTATRSTRRSRRTSRRACRRRRAAIRASPIRRKHTLPPQTQKTIGDTLSAKGISWAWYAGAWNAAVKDGMQPPDAPSAR